MVDYREFHVKHCFSDDASFVKFKGFYDAYDFDGMRGLLDDAVPSELYHLDEFIEGRRVGLLSSMLGDGDSEGLREQIPKMVHIFVEKYIKKSQGDILEFDELDRDTLSTISHYIDRLSGIGVMNEDDKWRKESEAWVDLEGHSNKRESGEIPNYSLWMKQMGE